jgi:HSP20 family protein
MTNLIRRNHDDRTVPTNRTQHQPWDPLRMMDALLGWDPLRDGGWNAHERAFSPTFEVKEVRDAYVIQADLPGVNESDVDVTVTGNALTVSGKREAEHAEKSHRYYALERGYGAFSRTFGLPDGVNLDELTANLKNGVLTLHIPKRPEVQPRKISLGKSGGEGPHGAT